MTLPIAGQFGLDEVALELDREGTFITLNDSDVRTLAGKSSGLITMYDLYGKQFYAPHRATQFVDSQGYFGDTPGNSAMDTTGTSVDSSTSASGMFFPPGADSISGTALYWGFGSRKSYTGTLTVRWGGFTQYSSVYDEEYGWTNNASSSVDILYSVDNGANWIFLDGISGGVSRTLQDSTVTRTFPHLNQVQVRIDYYGQVSRFNSQPLSWFWAVAGGSVSVSDILIY